MRPLGIHPYQDQLEPRMDSFDDLKYHDDLKRHGYLDESYYDPLFVHAHVHQAK